MEYFYILIYCVVDHLFWSTVWWWIIYSDARRL